MKLLGEFTAMLCGSFDNSVQLERFAAQGITGYPEARHVTPRTNAMPHLFLFTEEGDCVKLTSYEMPEGYTKDTFTAAGLGRLDYRTLRPSATFTPALYRKNGEWFEGGSESMFTPVLKFSLYERFSNEVLEVSESMEKDGRRTFGYDLPLEYRRTGC